MKNKKEEEAKFKRENCQIMVAEIYYPGGIGDFVNTVGLRLKLRFEIGEEIFEKEYPTSAEKPNLLANDLHGLFSIFEAKRLVDLNNKIARAHFKTVDGRREIVALEHAISPVLVSF